MINRIIFKIPEFHRAAYDAQRFKRNRRNLLIIGGVVLLMQIFILFESIANPFTPEVDVMRSYLFFYGISIVLGVLFYTVAVMMHRGEFKQGWVRALVYSYTYYIMFFAMGVGIYDQFQQENIVLYYGMMFVVAIAIDMSVKEHLVIFGSIQVLFILALLGINDRFYDINGVINDATQYLMITIIVNYYINELLKKNFVQQQMLLDNNRKLEFLSYYDSLSGLHNRRRWEELYHKMYDQAVNEGVPMSVMVIDIDFFKQYNDNYGHVAGDEVIRQVSKVLSITTEKTSGVNLGRYGGDEFAISVYDTDDLKIRQMIRDIKDLIEGLNIEHSYSLYRPKLTLSIGSFTGIPSRFQKPWDLVAEADKVLYKEKENRVVRRSSGS